jgi:hypothetical protein
VESENFESIHNHSAYAMIEHDKQHSPPGAALREHATMDNRTWLTRTGNPGLNDRTFAACRAPAHRRRGDDAAGHDQQVVPAAGGAAGRRAVAVVAVS